MLKLNVPGDGSKMLLHSCCAPCSGAVLECLLANGIRPVVFFSNSNITPFSEYELRRNELARYCKSLGVTMVDDEYDHDAWRGFVLAINDETSDGFRGELGDNGRSRAQELAAAPERGERCLRCFKFRLRRAAAYAAAHDIPVFTTTLASSRWKSLEQVAEAGDWAAKETCSAHENVAPRPLGVQGDNSVVPEEHNVLFWNQNWRRGGLQERRSQIICEQGFYNQNWCGCEFSHRNV